MIPLPPRSTLSLHDALPISARKERTATAAGTGSRSPATPVSSTSSRARSEEHTSELQSHSDLVCRLLLEKKNRRDERERDYRKTPVTYNTVGINRDN